MKIAVYGKNLRPENTEPVKDLIRELELRDCSVILHQNFKSTLPELTSKAGYFTTHNDLREGIDFLFSVGGDGTFLDTILLVRDSGIPVVGINTGRLGFLANIARDEVPKAVAALYDKEFTLDKRSLIKLNTSENLFGETNYGLNELTILKKDSSSMITIHTFVNDEYLNSYWADGLIVSTPTGSTAYSLSCGGPILTPETSNFILTPIAPHNLNVRPVVIPDSCNLKLKVEGRSEHYLVSLDSRVETIVSETELFIEKADFHLNMVRFNFNSFLSTIRNKLMWGLDRRN
jgi:NAD+ kinase